jgi:hypothetical protein
MWYLLLYAGTSMISTVTSKLDPQYGVIDALKTTFPMGSMTGAPKISAMKIMINEESRRGLYSWSVWLFTQMVILILMLLFGYFVQSRKKLCIVFCG